MPVPKISAKPPVCFHGFTKLLTIPRLNGYLYNFKIICGRIQAVQKNDEDKRTLSLASFVFASLLAWGLYASCTPLEVHAITCGTGFRSLSSLSVPSRCELHRHLLSIPCPSVYFLRMQLKGYFAAPVWAQSAVAKNRELFESQNSAF